MWISLTQIRYILRGTENSPKKQILETLSLKARTKAHEIKIETKKCIVV